MRTRAFRSSVGAACTAMLLAAAAVPLSAQSPAPRTPWGDPDLQGTYTNTYANGTPLERADQFAGRTLEDVRGEELANLRRAIQKRTVEAFLGPIHAPGNYGLRNILSAARAEEREQR